jgi:hypothetical protein
MQLIPDATKIAILQPYIGVVKIVETQVHIRLL